MTERDKPVWVPVKEGTGASVGRPCPAPRSQQVPARSLGSQPGPATGFPWQSQDAVPEVQVCCRPSSTLPSLSPWLLRPACLAPVSLVSPSVSIQDPGAATRVRLLSASLWAPELPCTSPAVTLHYDFSLTCYISFRTLSALRAGCVCVCRGILGEAGGSELSKAQSLPHPSSIPCGRQPRPWRALQEGGGRWWQLVVRAVAVMQAER